MPTIIRSFDREFKIWTYTVGHGKLLLRSCKSPGNGSRIDVLFSDVCYVQLRATARIHSIEEVTPSEWPAYLGEVLGAIHPEQKVYLLKSEGYTGCVAAGYIAWHEDDGEYGHPSVLLPG